MIEIRFTLHGWQQADAFLGRVEHALSDLSGAFTHVRDEVRQEIDDVFGNAASNRPHPWAPWRPWTADWRRNPPTEVPNYYASRPGGGNEIGVWSGDAKSSFKGEKSPGYTRISPDQLEMGVGSSEGGYGKWHVFIHGRAGQGGTRSYWLQGQGYAVDRASPWRVYPQSPRPLYENLNLESDGVTNPIARGMRRWFGQELGLTETLA